MIWYLLICGLDPFKSTCTWSPVFKTEEQCKFVQRQVTVGHMTKCIGIRA